MKSEGILRKWKLLIIAGGLIGGGGLIAGLLYLALRKRPEKKSGGGSVRVVRMKPKDRPEIPDDHIPIIIGDQKSVQTPATGAPIANDAAKEQAEVLKKTWSMRKRVEYGQEDILKKPDPTKIDDPASSDQVTPNPVTSPPPATETTTINSIVSSSNTPNSNTANNSVSSPKPPTGNKETNSESKTSQPATANSEEQEEMVCGIEDPIIAQKYDPLPSLQVLTGDCTVLRTLDQDLFLVQSGKDLYLAVQLIYVFDECLYLVRKTPLPDVLVPTRKSPCGRLLFYPIPALPFKPSKKRDKNENSQKYDCEGVKLLNAIIRTGRYKKEKLAYRRQFLNTLSVFMGEDVRLDDQHPIRLIQHPANKDQAFLLGLLTERKKALRMEVEAGEEYRGIYRVLVQLYPQGDDALYVFSYFGTNEFKSTHQPPPDRYIHIK